MNVLTLQSVLVVILNDMPFIMLLFNNVLIAIKGRGGLLGMAFSVKRYAKA